MKWIMVCKSLLISPINKYSGICKTFYIIIYVTLILLFDLFRKCASNAPASELCRPKERFSCPCLAMASAIFLKLVELFTDKISLMYQSSPPLCDIYTYILMYLSWRCSLYYFHRSESNISMNPSWFCHSMAKTSSFSINCWLL